jgi:tetratricopeptide (TPR) repeat protein
MNASFIESALQSKNPVLAREALRKIDLLLTSAIDANERVYLHFTKSSLYGILRNFEKAREELCLAVEQKPKDPNAQLTFEFNSALLYQQEGNYSEALGKFHSVMLGNRQKLNQPELRFMYEDIQQRRAFLSVTLRQFQEAIPLLREIVSFDLDKEVRSDALASLGLCYLEVQQWDSAKDYFLQARALGVTKEQEKTFHFYLGIAYFYKEAFDEAKREFEICEKHAGEYQLPTLDVYTWLSCVSRRLGDTAEAERYARLARAN